MKTRLLSLLCLFTFTVLSVAQDMILHYDFSNVEGTSVKDLTETGATAKLMSGAKVIKLGKYYVIDTGSGNGYLDMTSTAGAAIKSLASFTVSCYYYIDEGANITGAGNFLWSFSTSTNTQQTSGAYTAYRVNVQRMASSAAGWGGEVGFEVGTASTKGQWVHVLYRQTGAKGELFLNGKMVKSATNMPLMSKVFTTTPQYCFLGKPAFSADNYLKKTYITDFRIYNDVLDDATIATLSAKTEDITNEHLYGDPGDFTALKAKIAEINDFIAKAGDDYAKNAVAELQDEVSLATNEVSQGKLSQIFIDKRVNQLTAAYNNCVKTKGFSMLDVPMFSNTDRGFIHPGGLHTQADFDRVKTQLEKGNTKVKQAYQKLTSAAYSQSGVQTYPVETIVRGGGSGENYINAARGATMAYQNALRWKIGGTEANAKAAVRILMAWCNTTKAISGNSDQCLAVGLYGYQFAQAAELMRDYEGWSREDFARFQRWMLELWYPKAINFLRSRNGTWENSGKWWQAPGHYWSNWGLCNVLCVLSIGVLCDDVFIYNQGMSYFKYDQCGTFRDPRTEVPIKNDGLTEFLGNLVVTTSESELETAAYGELGQMNESGRDTGHSAMALGLAVDIAKQGWNQGDDLFAYMNHRLAAGIEYVAAQTQSVEGLPWVNYHYGSNGYYYTDSRAWLMEGPALGAQMRPYWGTVIGIYEGVKGVKMPFSDISYTNMGIDEGGQGSTSGGYDHLGYSVLMNTRDEQLCPAEQVPTELTPKMEYSGTLTTNLTPSLAQEKTRGLVNGKTLLHNELGGLVNTYTINNNTCVPTGQTLTLMPQLPEGEEDTGLWQWNTGEATRDITVTTDQSYIYRVTYTNQNGIKSQLCFSIAAKGDCTPDALIPSVTYDGSTAETNTIDVLYGKTATLSVTPTAGWGTYKWSTGATTQSITTSAIKKDQDITVTFTNQGGAISEVRFHLNVKTLETSVKVNGEEKHANEVIVNAGDNVSIEINIAGMTSADDILWSNGNKGKSVFLDNIQESMDVTATYEVDGEKQSQTFSILVYNSEYAELKEGKYFVRHIATDTYMTNDGESKPSFKTLENATDSAQIWYIYIKSATQGKYSIRSCKDDRYLTHMAAFNAKEISLLPHIFKPVKSERIAISSYTSAYKYWMLNQEGQLTVESTELTGYPFELIPADEITAIDELSDETQKDNLRIFTITGQHIGSMLKNGVYIVNGKKIIKR